SVRSVSVLYPLMKPKSSCWNWVLKISMNIPIDGNRSYTFVNQLVLKHKTRKGVTMAAPTKQDMPTTFDFKEAEERIYPWWEENGWVKPEVHPEGESFVIPMPPPNVTGALHLGHAMYTVEDVMLRYERMRGKAALWLPGTDH